MADFELFKSVTVPHLDKGGVIVAISGIGPGALYSVDFDRGDIQDFPATALELHA